MTVQTLPPADQSAAQCIGVFPLKAALEGGLAGGMGAVCAGLFTTISPLGGAVFGVSEYLSSHLISWICDKVDCCPDSMVAKVAKYALTIIGEIAAAAMVTTLVGFPMTVTSAVTLSITTIVATVVSMSIIACCCPTAGAAMGASVME